ncbi:hypothetical protein Smic_19740 [Streptomyces microflavus]|uniref:HTH tetR-type domain-containing protein n=1 Tax=Streptomyces microflavus TaxID=1919 RepID=A0A7J0CM91_STRMI|nr:hypothetical protein Smic_19740 [Streptomyces microflavus]
MGVDERRQQLIGVALDLFSRRSPEDVSIDEIAAAAGISRPLVYHYFPGKQSLYEAALRRAADELAARFLEPLEGPLGHGCCGSWGGSSTSSTSTAPASRR